MPANNYVVQYWHELASETGSEDSIGGQSKGTGVTASRQPLLQIALWNECCLIMVTNGIMDISTIAVDQSQHQQM